MGALQRTYVDAYRAISTMMRRNRSRFMAATIDEELSEWNAISAS